MTFPMARRTCFREQYYTGTRRYICVREDCRQYQAETICKILMVFHEYLRISKFVWARVLCGTRKYQSASVDCSGVIQKINTQKIRRDQGLVHDEDFLIFHGAKHSPPGPSARRPFGGSSGGPPVRGSGHPLSHDIFCSS